MQLKHVPLCFVILGSICLAGAVSAAAQAPVQVAAVSVTAN
jgi:hypothetical protein